MRLYQIDIRNKIVKFIWNIEKNQLVNAEKHIKTYTFDEILVKMESLWTNEVTTFEQIKVTMLASVSGDEDQKHELLEMMKDYALGHQNIFVAHYATVFYSRYNKIYKQLQEDNDQHLLSKAKKQQNVDAANEKIQAFYNEFITVINDDRNFDYHESEEMLVATPKCSLAVIRGKGHNEVYHIPDDMLLCFFYEFSYAVHELGYKVCECHFCHDHFLGAEKDICCNKEECQEEHKKLLSKQARAERKNNPYTGLTDNYHTYVRNKKKELKRAKVSPEKLDEFDDEKERRKLIVNKKKCECIEFGLPLSELINVIEANEAEIKRLTDKILGEL